MGGLASPFKTKACQLPYADCESFIYVPLHVDQLVVAVYTFTAELVPTSFDRRSGGSIQLEGDIGTPTPRRPFRSSSCAQMFHLIDCHPCPPPQNTPPPTGDTSHSGLWGFSACTHRSGLTNCHLRTSPSKYSSAILDYSHVLDPGVPACALTRLA